METRNADPDLTHKPLSPAAALRKRVPNTRRPASNRSALASAVDNHCTVENDRLQKTKKQAKNNPVQDRKTSHQNGRIRPRITGLNRPQIHSNEKPAYRQSSLSAN